MDGAALVTARARKERRYPELSEYWRARLVVFVCEVGGRWSEKTRDFLRHLAQRRAEVAWLFRCRVIMVCSAAKAFVSSDGCMPMTGEVIGDSRCEPVGE